MVEPGWPRVNGTIQPWTSGKWSARWTDNVATHRRRLSAEKYTLLADSQERRFSSVWKLTTRRYTYNWKLWTCLPSSCLTKQFNFETTSTRKINGHLSNRWTRLGVESHSWLTETVSTLWEVIREYFSWLVNSHRLDFLPDLWMFTVLMIYQCHVCFSKASTVSTGSTRRKDTTLRNPVLGEWSQICRVPGAISPLCVPTSY